MIVKFQMDVPFIERLKILWYGRIFVRADYKGQHEKLRVEIGAVNKNATRL